MPGLKDLELRVELIEEQSKGDIEKLLSFRQELI